MDVFPYYISKSTLLPYYGLAFAEDRHPGELLTGPQSALTLRLPFSSSKGTDQTDEDFCALIVIGWISYKPFAYGVRALLPYVRPWYLRGDSCCLNFLQSIVQRSDEPQESTKKVLLLQNQTFGDQANHRKDLRCSNVCWPRKTIGKSRLCLPNQIRNVSRCGLQ